MSQSQSQNQSQQETAALSDDEQPAPPDNQTTEIQEPVADPEKNKQEPLDGPWHEAARAEGFSEEEIRRFASEEEARRRVESRRRTSAQAVLQQIGLDAPTLAEFIRWKAATAGKKETENAESGTEAEPTLRLNVQDLPEEASAPLKTIETAVNAVAAENRRLKEQMRAMRDEIRQSVELLRAQQEAAAGEARIAAEFDQAAQAVPGFVEAMGLPSEAAKKSADDPVVRRYQAFRAFFEPVYRRYAEALGHDRVPLAKVIQEAFRDSPFSAHATTGGHPGNEPRKLHSTIRGSSRKEPTHAKPGEDPMGEELARINDVIERAFEEYGGNPFRASTMSAP